jgi:hypothetical protein
VLQAVETFFGDLANQFAITHQSRPSIMTDVDAK